ncbi:hypothetical protein BH23CHL8_BH23CHL8_26630 [soil metagenome]
MSAAERRRDGVIEPRNERNVPTQRGSAWVRLVGAVGMVALTLALWWLLTDAGFRVDVGAIRVSGVHYAEGARVQELLSDLARSPNVFRVRPRAVERGLMTLPEVRSVRASVHLPAEVRVQVIERQPIFVWSNGGDAWLVDREGVLFARPGPEDMPTTLATRAIPNESDDASAPADEDLVSARLAPRGLPMVEDGRIVAQAPGLGYRLGELDLAVLRQLLVLTPEMIGSASSSLRLRVDELDGYVLESLDLPWQAVFGRYSPTLHPPRDIPRQVQCLAALLKDREARLTRVWLVTSGVVCGTHQRIVPAD